MHVFYTQTSKVNKKQVYDVLMKVFLFKIGLMGGWMNERWMEK